MNNYSKLILNTLGFLIVLALILLGVRQATATEPPIILKDYPIIIACKDMKTGVFHTPANDSREDGGCLIGKNMKSILLPSKSQMILFKEVYGDRASILTAITITNSESQFHSKAKGCHKLGCDHGLLQIRDIYGGKQMTDKQQLLWFKNRKQAQMTKGGTCSRTTALGNHSNTLRCIFARHRGDINFHAYYPSSLLAEHQFYSEYIGNKKLIF